MEACQREEWEDAKIMIAKDPRLCTIGDYYICTPAFWTAHHGNIEILHHMADAIFLLFLNRQRTTETTTTSQEESDKEDRRRQMLWDAFERANTAGVTPAHLAAHQGYVDCLAFLVEHAPSGAAILTSPGVYTRTPASHAAIMGKVDALNFIVRNVSGVMERVLETMDDIRNTFLEQALRRESNSRVTEYLVNIKNKMPPLLSSSSKSQKCSDVQNHP